MLAEIFRIVRGFGCIVDCVEIPLCTPCGLYSPIAGRWISLHSKWKILPQYFMKWHQSFTESLKALEQIQNIFLCALWMEMPDDALAPFFSNSVSFYEFADRSAIILWFMNHGQQMNCIVFVCNANFIITLCPFMIFVGNQRVFSWNLSQVGAHFL